MDDSWSASTSVMDIGFVTAHGSILGVRPVMSNASVGHGSAHWDIVFVAHCDRLTGFLGLGQYVIGRVPSVSTEVFWACSVIVKIDDECILHSLRFLKGFEECSHCLIHVINHCCIDCHVTDAPGLVVYGVPWLDPVFPRGQGPALLVDDSHLEHAGISFPAQFLPSALVGLEVFADGFLRGMDGPMGGGEGNVLKERFVGFRKFPDLPTGLDPDAIRVIVILLVDLGKLGIAGQGIRIIKGTGPRHGPVEIIETALDGSVLLGVSSKVPFSYHSGLVTGWLEKFRNGYLTGAQTIAVDPAHQGGPCGPTPGCVVELGEPQAVLGELVQVGGIDFPSEASEVRESHVVREDDDDVGTIRLFGRQG